MKKKIILFLSAVVYLSCLTGCTTNIHDCVRISGRSTTNADDVRIYTKEGYFYDSHEKFTVDEDTIGLTIYFSTENGDEWSNDSKEKVE